MKVLWVTALFTFIFSAFVEARLNPVRQAAGQTVIYSTNQESLDLNKKSCFAALSIQPGLSPALKYDERDGCIYKGPNDARHRLVKGLEVELDSKGTPTKVVRILLIPSGELIVK